MPFRANWSTALEMIAQAADSLAVFCRQLAGMRFGFVEAFLSLWIDLAIVLLAMALGTALGWLWRDLKTIPRAKPGSPPPSPDDVARWTP